MMKNKIVFERSHVCGHIQELIDIMKNQGVSRKCISDGYHTFEELYYHRAVLFATICKMRPQYAWKSKLHNDGTMFDDQTFIVGIDTPEGMYTYHYNMEYWGLFDVKELQYAPKWDGHDSADVTRLLSLVR